MSAYENEKSAYHSRAGKHLHEGIVWDKVDDDEFGVKMGGSRTRRRSYRRRSKKRKLSRRSRRPSKRRSSRNRRGGYRLNLHQQISLFQKIPSKNTPSCSI